MAVPPSTRRPDLLDQDSAEQIRRREVSRTIEKMDLSAEGEEAIAQLSCSLVSRLLRGPISEIIVRAKIRASHRERGVDRAPNTNGIPESVWRKCGPVTTSKRDGDAQPGQTAEEV
jgi:hypothetical protein